VLFLRAPLALLVPPDVSDAPETEPGRWGFLEFPGPSLPELVPVAGVSWGDLVAGSDRGGTYAGLCIPFSNRGTSDVVLS
jgi:hypothetical protein